MERLYRDKRDRHGDQPLGDFIAAEARRLGFHRVGLVPVAPPLRYRAYVDWIARGMHGTMAYMAAAEHVSGRADLHRLAAGARTVVVVALAYAKSSPAPASRFSRDRAETAIRGFVARYARGSDYHAVMKKRLYALAEAIGQHIGRPVAARPCVDTAPVLERDLAEAAGIGFTAKNTMLIAPGLGSYVLLGELLLDVDAATTAIERPKNRCGSCRACLDACPTGAFVDAYVLDARRCISYLTIEHKGPIPRHLRRYIGTMIFGCDICQEVCPFNAQAPDRTRPDGELAALDSERGTPDLLALLSLGANQRRRYVDGTALRRVNREQLVRNLCVALGNAGDPRAIEPLTRMLGDRSPVVRSHAAWALGQLGARDACTTALERETDATVREELDAALAHARASTTSPATNNPG
ncbi:MAG: tRNA epoxyqueuosine(34) reductase QueG [Proteobacteria bacterium]|nr:tRNA epoxyqueuosine(34) reductase QueG [Pseudomonadota bacterium]